jgi:hypothetical protein
MRKGGSWRKGRGDYKDDMITYVTWGSHNRGELLEGDRINCVPPASYFQRVCLLVQSRFKMRADDRDEAEFENMSIGRRIAVSSLSRVAQSLVPFPVVGLVREDSKEMKSARLCVTWSAKSHDGEG